MRSRKAFCKRCKRTTKFRGDVWGGWECTEVKRNGLPCPQFENELEEDREEFCDHCHATSFFRDEGNGVWSCSSCRRFATFDNVDVKPIVDLTGPEDVSLSASPPGLMSDLEKRAFEPDFHIVAENGAKVGCHKAILGLRSPVFANMMGWKEGTDGEVKIKEPEEVIKAFVDFFYTDTLPDDINSTDVEKLLALAEMYDLPKLKHLTERVMLGKVGPQNAVRYLRFGDQHNANDLKAVAVRCLLANFEEVAQSADWRVLGKENPALVFEITTKIAKGYNLVPKSGIDRF